MLIKKGIIVTGSKGRAMATDIFFVATGEKKPVIIYAHGFNGFKDWGNFDLIARQFADVGFVFVKFNFSHNGTTLEQPEEFVDLEAYGNNNYTIQLDDLELIIDWAVDPEKEFEQEIDPENLYLLGHSLGGGLVILKAAEDRRVKKIVTWAAISECKTPWTNWTTERIGKWKKTGVEFTLNSRTKQELPLYYQLYENFQQNRERLDIQKAIASLKIPVLLCHGSKDEAVPVEKANDLKTWQPAAELFIVESDHVFGRKHPWISAELPEAMQDVVLRTIKFF